MMDMSAEPWSDLEEEDEDGLHCWEAEEEMAEQWERDRVASPPLAQEWGDDWASGPTEDMLEMHSDKMDMK